MDRGQGVEVCLEAVGGHQSDTLQIAQRTTAARGRSLVAGGSSDALSLFPVSDLKNREQALIGSHGHPGTFGPVLELIASGDLPVTPLISHTVGLDGLAGRLTRMSTRSEGIIKAVVVP